MRLEEVEQNPIELPNLLPARMLNEFVYCPRLFYLEWVQGEFAENTDVLEGHLVHRRVEREVGRLPDPEEGEELQFVKIHARSVMLSSHKVGLIARIDLVEGKGREVRPVDYKKGRAPDAEGGAWDADRIQLCAQGLILQENGFECDEGVVYYAGSKRRVILKFTEDLVDETLHHISRALEIASSCTIPPPLIESSKCPRCSLVGICLPDETEMLASSRGADEEGATDVRRLYPARRNALPVYVQEQGLTVGKKGDCLEIRRASEAVEQVRLLDISQLCLYGNVQLTTQAMRALAQRDVSVCYFSYGGWFYGIAHGMTHKNVDLRIRQYRVTDDASASLDISRRFVEGKIRNCRTLLRRNHPEKPRAALRELDRLRRRVYSASDVNILLGLEGAASRVYFLHFAGMIKCGDDESIGPAFDFQSRNKRPPKDPVNALLSFLYAVLTKEMTVTLLSVGFDPYLGFYHRPRYGRPALALDLMEEFRPIIVDSVVVSAINNGEIKPIHFIRRGPATALIARGRKKILGAFERRMDTTVTHPLFGYKVSYRRILEVQARLLGRHLLREVPSYIPFTTR